MASGKQNEAKPLGGKYFSRSLSVYMLHCLLLYLSCLVSSALDWNTWCSVRHVWQHVGQRPKDDVSGPITAKSKHIKSIINTGSQCSWSVQNASSEPKPVIRRVSNDLLWLESVIVTFWITLLTNGSLNTVYRCRFVCWCCCFFT